MHSCHSKGVTKEMETHAPQTLAPAHTLTHTSFSPLPPLNIHTHTHTQPPDFNPTTTAEVDDYHVTYTPANGGAIVVLTVGANDTERSLTGLMMGTKYNITIVATNTAGDGNAVVLVQPTHINSTFMREGGREIHDNTSMH